MIVELMCKFWLRLVFLKRLTNLKTYLSFDDFNCLKYLNENNSGTSGASDEAHFIALNLQTIADTTSASSLETTS